MVVQWLADSTSTCTRTIIAKIGDIAVQRGVFCIKKTCTAQVPRAEDTTPNRRRVYPLSADLAVDGWRHHTYLSCSFCNSFIFGWGQCYLRSYWQHWFCTHVVDATSLYKCPGETSTEVQCKRVAINPRWIFVEAIFFTEWMDGARFYVL